MSTALRCPPLAVALFALAISRHGLAQPIQFGPTSKLTDERCEDGPVGVAMRDDDTFLLLTYSHCADSGNQLTAQVFQADGTPASPAHALDLQLLYGTSLAPLGNGGSFVAAWTPLADGGPAIVGQFLDPQGAPLGAPRMLSDRAADDPASNSSYPRVAVDALGNLTVVWQAAPPGAGPSAPYVVRLRRFASDATPLGPSSPVEPAPGVDQRGAWLSVQPDGSALVTWMAIPPGGRTLLRARRFTPSGDPAGDSVVVNDLGGPADLLASRSLATPDGGYTVGWVARASLQQPAKSVHLRHLAASGEALPEVSVDSGDPTYEFGFDLANAGHGNLFFAWGSEAIGYSVGLVNLDGTGAWPQQPVRTAQGLPIGPWLASNASGEAVVAWAGDAQSVHFPVGNVVMGYDAFAQTLRHACDPDPSLLCLGADDRFRARLTWTSPVGSSAAATPTRLSALAGGFWFFARSNPEILVKVLDGRAINGHFWVLFGGMTNLAFRLTITDSRSGATVAYDSSRGTFASRADTLAFTDAGAPVASPPAAALATRSVPASDGTTACGEDAGELCLRGRFRASVRWQDVSGNGGSAHPLSATTEGGVLWFFDPRNPELSLKVLDGTAINGSYWLFVASLTNQAYELTLTDTLTGRTRTYSNPAGQMRSFADTRALPIPG